MKPWFRVFLFALLLFLANGMAVAEDVQGAAQTLHWRCWYDQRVHVTCLVDTIPDAGNLPAQLLPSNLPDIVKVLRSDPGTFRHRFVHIPLYTQPNDMAFTALLARMSVCGSRPDCTVNYSHTPPPISEIAALLGKTPSDLAEDPALQRMLLEIVQAPGSDK